MLMQTHINPLVNKLVSLKYNFCLQLTGLCFMPPPLREANINVTFYSGLITQIDQTLTILKFLRTNQSSIVA